MKPKLTLIAAIDENRLLADEKGIPWRLPRDVQHFRAYAEGKWLLVGRRTFEEMRGWFNASHTPLVLSSRCGLNPQGARGIDSIPHALALAGAAGQRELVVCGGGQTYAAALPYADKLVLTVVGHRFAAGEKPVYFPAWNQSEWQLRSSETHSADGDNAWPMCIQAWVRAS